MKILFSFPVYSLGLLAAFISSSPCFALSYTIGQFNSNDYADNLQGQSFAPNQIGGNGSGVAPASGTVTLSSFTLAYDSSGARSPVSTLYIYTSLPTSGNLASGTGALYTSTSFSDLTNDTNFGFPSRTYFFTNADLEASQKYFALTPSEQSFRYFFGASQYSGGAFVNSTILETGSGSDLAFRANLAQVPFEFSPMGGLIIGGILFTIQRYKRSKS